MDDTTDEDTCRICAMPADEQHPLFHPCKCSGTIRYIHQECLATWLAHSKKTTCDVCKHKFAFTKVYDPEMPERLPMLLFARRIVGSLSTLGLFVLRGILVGIVWLAVLPYSTVWTWRFYFWSGDILAWFVAGRQRDLAAYLVVSNTTSVTLAANASDTSSIRALHPILRSISSDIFTGQIITSVVVLLFLAVFLLREWIFQNVPGDNVAVEEGALGPVDDAAPGANPADGPGVMPEGIRVDVQVQVDVDDGDDDDDGARLFRDPDAEEGDDPPQGRPPGGAALMQMVVDNANPDDTAMPDLIEMSSSESEDIRPGPSLKQARRRSSIEIAKRRNSVHAAAIDEAPSSSTSLPADVAASSPNGSSEPSTDQQLSPVSVNGTAHPAAGPSNTGKRKRPEDEVGDEGLTFKHSGRRRPRNGFELSTSHKTPPNKTKKRYNVSTSEFRKRTVPFAADDAEDWMDIDSDEADDQQENVQTAYPAPHEEALADPLPAAPTATVSNGTKGKERAAPPPRIILERAQSSLPSSTVPQLSPARTSPRRPGLPPSLPTPGVRPSPLRAAADAASSGSASARARAGESPGNAYYRAPEDMDYFGDVEDMQKEGDAEGPSTSNAPPVSVNPGHLVPPARDLTVNVPNPPDDLPVDLPPLIPAVAPPAVPGPVHAHAPAGGQRVLENFEQPVQIEGPPGIDAARIEPVDAQGNALDDDMDGILEAVGIRGPIASLFQNACLMMCILDMAIGGAIWVPFVLGKSVALLSLDPRRTLRLINLPIKLIRLFTDPIVDISLYLLRYLARTLFRLQSLFVPRVVRTYVTRYADTITRVVNTTIGATEAPVSTTPTLSMRIPPYVQSSLESCMNWALSYFDSVFDAHPSVEESLATVGAFVRHIKPRLRELASAFGLKYRAFVEQDTALNRTYATALGYLVFGICLAIWMQGLTPDRLRGFTKNMRDAVRQQLLVVKVAFFIVIELVLFPLGCGIVLDLCAMPLFKDTTVMSRVAFSVYAPMTSTFLHWIAGTMFMFQFAVLLDGCRKIMRPGAMWFIRDPQDPQFSPIQDILSRPASSQLRKLFTSAILYCIIVFGGLGSVIWFLRHFRPFSGFLPLRWNMWEPISEIPIDLLFIHVVVPATVKQLRIRRYLNDMATRLWKGLSARMRLTSYMFGGRHPGEEITPAVTKWYLHNKHEADGVADGGLYRVPANDHIVIIPNAGMMVTLDWSGEPIDEAARERREKQDEETHRHGRNPEDDYTAVYLPPNFARRILVFTVVMWLVGMAGAVLFIAAPLVTGRAILDVIVKKPLHDGYSFGIGFHVLALAFYFGMAVFRVLQRRPNLSALRVLARQCLKGSAWLAKAVYLVLFFYVIIPIFVGIAMELHVVLPLRFCINPNETPVVYIAEDWAVGVVVTQIFSRLLRLRRIPVLQALEEARANNWANPRILRITRDVILPVLIMTTLATIIPALLGQTIIRLGFFHEQEIVIYRMIYPMWIMIFLQTTFFMRVFELIGKWMQSIRDKEFLVELRLRNLDQGN